MRRIKGREGRRVGWGRRRSCRLRLSMACLVAMAFVVFRAHVASARTIVVPTDSWGVGGALSAAQPGDTIRVLPGVYTGYYDDTTAIREGVAIVGSGASVTVLRWSKPPYRSVLKAENVRGVRIEGVTIMASLGEKEESADGFPRGGALLCLGSEVLLRDCVVVGQGALVREDAQDRPIGAIYASGGSSLTLLNCVLERNYCWEGAAVYVAGYPTPCSLTMTGRVLESNFSTGTAGALKIEGEAEVILEGCRFAGNCARRGGAISCTDGARVTVRNSVLAANILYPYGGGGAGIAAENCDLTASNCVIANNVFWCGHGDRVGGAGIFCKKGSLALTNCTVSGNRILASYNDRGGGVFLDGAAGTITNCIFWDNTGDISSTSAAKLNVSYCNMEDMFPGPTIVHVPPKLVDAESEDFRLCGDSPCIDMGTDDPTVIPPTDIEGKPRVIFGGRFDRPDLGAYEYDPSVPLRICTESLGEAIADHEYRQELKATGGSGPYFWQVASGGLPPGLELSADGVISGIPAAPGNYELGVLVANLQNEARHRTYHLNVSGYEHWYVDANVASSGDGKSWSTAFASIQDAVRAAGNGDVVHVAPGRYFGRIRVEIPIDLLGPGPDQASIEGLQQYGSIISFFFLPFGRLSGFTITYGRDMQGGGLFLYESAVTIENCIIESNYAGRLGGGIYANFSPAKIENCIIRNNMAGEWAEAYVGAGGGIYSHFSLLKINRCIFENNRIYSEFGNDYRGGGLALHGSRQVITNSLIARNYLDCLRRTSWTGGAGVFALFGSPTITNCTIADNYVRRPEGVYYAGGIGAMDCWASITNCIIWGNTVDLLGAYAEFSVVGTPPESVEGRGNISVDPQFVNPASWDYRLKDTSPCIDSGQNLYIEGFETDLDGNNRILNGLVDMGAYENPRHVFGRLVIGKDGHAVALAWNSLPGESYAVEASTDLLHWERIANASSQGPYSRWVVPWSAVSPTFYRVCRETP